MAKILANGQIQVERGDTLYAIAQQVFGNGSRWKELGFNGDPKSLQVGTVLNAPSGSSNFIGPTKPVSKLASLIGPAPKTTTNNTNSGGTTSTSAPAANKTPQQIADEYINNILDSTTKPFLDAQSRAKEFDEKNPFSFDEALARSSAEERLDPYYKAELGTYIQGVETARGRTAQDEEKIRNELGVSIERTQTDTERFLDRAVRASEEGFAGDNIFSSGERLAGTGQQRVDTQFKLDDFVQGANSQIQDSTLRQTRRIQDLNSGARDFQRRLTAEKETSILSDVNQQKSDRLRKRELDRQSYIGFPYSTGTQALNSTFGLS